MLILIMCDWFNSYGDMMLELIARAIVALL